MAEKLSAGEKARQETSHSSKIIKEVFRYRPKICIELGSGQKAFAEEVKARYQRLPKNEKEIIEEQDYYQEECFKNLKFFDSRMSGHDGKLIATKDFWLLCGRLHTYEGHDIHRVVQPVRALALAGAQSFILCSASGSINPKVKPGQMVSIKDDIYRTGTSPLKMPHCSHLLDSEFVDLSSIYCSNLKRTIKKLYRQLTNQNLFEARLGVFIDRRGYERPAEILMARNTQCDIVGVSISPQAEALAGMPKHLEIAIAGISCVTNSHCLEHEDGIPSHEKVVDIADQMTREQLTPLLFKFIELKKSQELPASV